MFCPKCGTENKKAAKFCKKCGHQLSTKTSAAGGFGKGLWATSSAARIAVLAAPLMIAGIVICLLLGGGRGPYGTYVNQDNSEEYLDLKEDGTFYLKELGIGFTGEWDIEGDVLRFYFSELGLATEGRLEGDKIMDSDGKTWVRRSRSAPEVSTSFQHAIIGKWQKTSEPELVLEFSKDGTLNVVDPERLSVSERIGSYEFVDSDTIQMTAFDSGPAIVDITISSSGDTLTLYSSLSGSSEEYRKLR